MTSSTRLWGASALAAGGAALLVVALTHQAEPRRSVPRQFAAPTASTTTHARPPVAASADPVGGTSAPSRLTIAALDVRAPVVPVASSARQVLDIPKRPATIGWWAAGAAPGAAIGTAVLVGHVDSAKSGPGALFHLDRIGRGNRIDVRDTAGHVASYRVSALRVVHKTAGLDPALFATDGPPRLVLITCGGAFDRHTHSYADNIVAVANRVERS